MKKAPLSLIALLSFASTLLAAPDSSPAPTAPLSVVSLKDGRLDYKKDPQGNTLLDFSNCGYGGGGVPLPTVDTVLTLNPTPGEADDTKRLQAAIDKVSAMPLNPKGLRGALLLTKGTYHINDALYIKASGVVLRGEGDSENGTLLIATGTKFRDLIQFEGGPVKESKSDAASITDPLVPVGAHSFNVANASHFKIGDTVFVARVGNQAWIDFLGMNNILKRPGNPDSTKNWQPFTMNMDRVITKIDGNTLTIDAPVSCAIDKQWGGGTVTKIDTSARLQNVGLENLRADSTFDKSVMSKEGAKDSYYADEKHADGLASMTNVENGWAKNLTSTHFYAGVMDLGVGAKWITTQDCSALDPVSIITGGRRYAYAIRNGQLSLFLRCYARKQRHAFVVLSRIPGPNAFVQCNADENYNTSEPHERWSTGGLYDEVNAAMAFQDREWMGSGHGYSGADYVAWNCEGSLVCESPRGATNYAIGFVGIRTKPAFPPRTGSTPGEWQSFGQHVSPKSLYFQQLQDRLGPTAVAAISKP